MSNNQQLQKRETTASLAVRTGESLGFTRDQIEVIKDNVARGASDAQLAMFLHVAKRAGLDPIAKQICMIERGGRWTIQTTIDGYRLIADRTNKYVPGRKPTFEYKDDKLHSATAYVKKLVGGEWHEIEATAYYDEYVQIFNGQVGNMWKKMPHVMLSKCAEALALRRAFPAEMSGIYTADEMTQADMHEIDTHTLSDEQAEAALREAQHVEQGHVIDVEASVSDAPTPSKRAQVASIKERRAQSLVAMNLVTRDGDLFRVQTPAIKGKSFTHTVQRDVKGHVVCTCEDFQDEVIKDEKYLCEHILAVKIYLEAQQKASADQSNSEGGGGTTSSPSHVSSTETFNRLSLLQSIEDARAKLEANKVEPGWSIEELTIYINEKYEVEHGINDPALSLDQLKEIKTDLWARVDLFYKFNQPEQKENKPQSDAPSKRPPGVVGTTVSNMATPKQLGMIRALAKEADVDADQECQSLWQCFYEELSKKGASLFIDHLKSLKQ